MIKLIDVRGLQTDRRGFLKLSAAGAATLSTLSTGVWLAGCASDEAATGMKQLRAGDVELFRAMIPAIMKGRIGPDDTEAIERTLQSFDTLLDDLSPGVVDALRPAFDVLTFGPTRALLAGQWSSWSKASVDDAESSLNRLRDSSIGLLNAIYAAVVRLVGGSYYFVPEYARTAGYPGPPQKVAGVVGATETAEVEEAK